MLILIGVQSERRYLITAEILFIDFTLLIMDQIVKEVLVPTVDGMKRNGTPYKGILYAGIMLTQGGPRVLEFNVRFGDPETQPILIRLKSDLLETMLAVCDGRLDEMKLECLCCVFS